MNEIKKETGIRFDQGKLRYDLVNPLAHEGMVDILTFGSVKYAARNWEKGMAWSKVIASLKRHLAQIEKGEDYDKESGRLHADHVACNAHFLSAYYRIYPQGDDRPHKHLNMPKIGLDIDEVLCDWLTSWRFLWGITEVPTSWFFDREIRARFEEMKKNNTLDQFYSSLPPLLKPEEIPFEPHCYITSRPCSLETTVKWLDVNGFPTKPVYCVDVGKSKVDVAKEAGIDIFVDDCYDNFVALNNAGICCFLYDQSHNRRYDVGFKRIHSLKELL